MDPTSCQPKDRCLALLRDCVARVTTSQHGQEEGSCLAPVSSHCGKPDGSRAPCSPVEPLSNAEAGQGLWGSSFLQACGFLLRGGSWEQKGPGPLRAQLRPREGQETPGPSGTTPTHSFPLPPGPGLSIYLN